ncbi:MAG: DNA-3-methyladenine glycosylase 2 family protein [Planctomycetes bacterium]|nr:DNA-3-methyladenine glycosylase 2 family protein [Planctomycetota bacterium]
MSLTYDPAEAIAHLTKIDPLMGDLIARVGAFTLTPELTQSPFHALMRAIVYQQLSGKAAGTILGRVLALMPKGRGRPRPEDFLALDDQRLRAAGLSQNKLLALRDLATKAQEGIVPTLAALRRLTDAEIIERLTAVRGIGVWTVEMLLLFHLGRSDVLPIADLGVQKGYQITYRKRSLPSAKQLLAAGERWRPYRSVASWYLWRAADAEKAARTNTMKT